MLIGMSVTQSQIAWSDIITHKAGPSRTEQVTQAINFQVFSNWDKSLGTFHVFEHKDTDKSEFQQPSIELLIEAERCKSILRPVLSRLEETTGIEKKRFPYPSTWLAGGSWERQRAEEGWTEKWGNDANGEMIGKLARARSSRGSYHADRMWCNLWA